MFFAIDSTNPDSAIHVLDDLPEVSPPSGEWWRVSGCSTWKDAGAIAARTPNGVARRDTAYLVPKPNGVALALPLPPPAAGVSALATPSNSSLSWFPGTK